MPYRATSHQSHKTIRWTLLLFLLPMLLACGMPQPSIPATPPPATTAPSNVAEDRAMGDPNAPVTLVEYGDYQWPYCATFARGAMKELEQTYIKTGKVRFVFRDFPTPNHTSAVRAAHAAHCAADQGRYWDMHDALFAHQDRLGGDHDADFVTLRDLAGSIGLDTDIFMTCMESRKYLGRITNDVVAGEAKGVRATPAYLLDDQLLLGLYPAGTWKKLIDQELAK